uniref:Complement component c3a, duplicate 5 n=1 Tax=Gasterosteus aculeatus aculeatus TaxID=481459 RepID=G3Q4W5_GASAC|nr:complement C3-like [Gasterosteus aculeatus aculeatus]
MSRTMWWLVASVASTLLTCLANGAPLKVMSAPNLLRVGTAEQIFVECQDCTGGDINVVISVWSHPTKNRELANIAVTLNAGNHFQQLGRITIPAGDFSREASTKHYVYLKAQFPDRVLEKVVMLSFQSGYIFIQTDKTLYTPKDKILYRMFAVTPRMEPVGADAQNQPQVSISIEIVTPEGVIVPRDPVSLISGIHSGDYQLPEIASPGLWKVVTRFHSNPHQSYSAEFEVKEYVLPSFEVKLKPTSSFFYVDSEEFTVNIEAKYLFDEWVDGTAFVVFGVIQEDQKQSFPSSLQRVPITRGHGEVTLKREHITNTFPEILDLVGTSMFVAVSVLTDSGGEMVEAELRNIQIVQSPYTILFKKTPKYFKPGMSFDVMVEVENPDGSPAKGVKVVVEPGSEESSTGDNGLAKLTVNTKAETPNLQITAKTSDPAIRPDRQASASMEALAYTTNSKSYIHISVDAAEPKLKDNMKISLNLERQETHNTDITILILSRGQLVSFRRHKIEGQTLISLIVSITKEMLPSFRIVAYYHTNANEVVSDSVWVDVKDSCMGSLKLEPTTPRYSYEPGRSFVLKVTGDPEAKVGLLAVDRGVYVLNNKHRLTQKKVWDIVAKYDTGCTPGGGKDGMGVFYDAGLMFESSAASGTPYRQELKCPTPSRRKRATTIAEVTTSLLSQYKNNQLQRTCCLDGMKETLLSYTCERRSEYINDGEACVTAFLRCCKEMETQRAERKEDSLLLARSEENDNSYMDSNYIVSRSKFPESWLWLDIDLPACPNQTPNCETTSVTKNVALQDSITTWELTGISLSKTHGICIGDPLAVIVRKEFFIDLRLPYSAVTGEQLEVKAILHNYSPDIITVRVDLIEAAHLCSAAYKRGKYRQEVRIGPQTTRSVPFVVIPMKEGEHRMEVKAAVKDSSLHDGIWKNLRVVPRGELVTSPQSVTLDPSKNGIAGKQEETLNSRIPEADLIPGTPTITQVSVTGREQISTIVSAVGGSSMDSLIQQPSGCGEQNMIKMTLPVIATTYLDRTNQWETVGFDQRNKALEHIKTGYQNELIYLKGDGSFAVFTGEQISGTWLTAYVAKVFSMAYSLVSMRKNHICDAIKYLILNTQQPDGVFVEKGRVVMGEMIGDVRGKDSDASMTAFCLIAMQESRALCGDTVNTAGSINNAVTYLERRLPNLVNPYAVAMTSYALANEGKLNHQILYNFVSPERNHWQTSGGGVHTLEATAYALLALVKAEKFEDAKPVVRWFNEQQRYHGGYGSTQATIMVYQAIAEYWAGSKEPEYSLDVDILFEGRTNADPFKFTRENYYTTRTSKSVSINQNVTVTATGSGEATIRMVSLYYTRPKEKESDCQKFNLSVQLLPEKMDVDPKVYKLKIEVLYKDTERDATMSILDIGLLTGFTADINDLNRLSKGPARTIANYEMNTVLSDRGSLIIYLNKVSHTLPEEITFRVHQTMKAAALQPAAVSVYDYYDEKRCVKFYHPEREAGMLTRLCKKDQDECTCAEENCSMQKKDQVSNDQRTEKICETEVNNQIDFAYKVKVELSEEDPSIDVNTVRVLKTIKEGSKDVRPVNKLRTFISLPHCRESLDLRLGKTYLIMGSSRDITAKENDQSFQYFLGGRTWIEYWPTNAECQKDEYRPTCAGIENMVDQYETFGCQQ